MNYLKRCVIPVGIMTAAILLLLAGAACTRIPERTEVELASPTSNWEKINAPYNGDVYVFPYQREGREYLVFLYVANATERSGISVVEIRPTPAEYDINEEWPGRYDNATESWEFPPEMGTDIRPTPAEMEGE